MPTLLINGMTERTNRMGEPFVFTGEGYTPRGRVQRYIDPPVNGSRTGGTVTADAGGRIEWSFTPRCGGKPSVFTIFVIDVSTGRESNRVKQTIVANPSCQ